MGNITKIIITIEIFLLLALMMLTPTLDKETTTKPDVIFHYNKYYEYNIVNVDSFVTKNGITTFHHRMDTTAVDTILERIK